jgi:hypothetical protein
MFDGFGVKSAILKVVSVLAVTKKPLFKNNSAVSSFVAVIKTL